jgi:feruloyl esterase
MFGALPLGGCAIAACMAVLATVPMAGRASPASTAEQCKALAGQDFTGVLDAPTRIQSSRIVAAKAPLPAYCEVRAYVWPQVQMFLWLPTDAWTGRFVGIGCGGACGVIERVDASGVWQPIVRRGDAAMFTDMGHSGRDTTDLLWAIDNPQAQIDYGFRATHVATVAGKAIARALYGRDVQWAYFVGNSTGGRQGLLEAQRFPADYQGIVAKCPAISEKSGDAIIWTLQALSDRMGRPLLAPANLTALGDAVARRCDASDGVEDGVLSAPQSCHFDPAEASCERHPTAGCLAPEQLAGVRLAYLGMPPTPGHARSGLPFGSESLWLNRYVSKDGSRTSMWDFMLSWLRADEPVWAELQRHPPVSLMDYDVEHYRGVRGTYQLLHEADNPDLSEFAARGGKLIMMQGMADVIVQPAETTRFYDTAVRTGGGLQAVQRFFRYFLMPGVGHCFAGDGPGADVFDGMADITRWVEDGAPPDEIVAMHLRTYHGLFPDLELPVPPEAVVFSRPLYPYPAHAVYRGRGDWHRAASFEADAPKAVDDRYRE